ncbi:MAG: hypothetical protein QXG35_06220 [Nitrososphaerota archaeon]
MLSIKPPKGAPKRKRPLSPIQVAKYLNEWLQESSATEVSRKLGLKGTEMLREFLSLLQLPSDVQKFFENWEIGIDKGYRISMLDKAEDQREVINAIIRHNLSSSDVRSIVFLKKMNPEIPIEECIRKVLESRKKVRYHIVLTGIDEDTLQILQIKSEQLHCSAKELVKKLMEDTLGTSEGVIMLDMRGNLIKMVITPKTFKMMKEKAKELNVSFDDLIDRLVKNWLCGKN